MHKKLAKIIKGTQQYDVYRAEYMRAALEGFSKHNLLIFSIIGIFGFVKSKPEPEMVYSSWIVCFLSVICIAFTHMNIKERIKEVLYECYVCLLMTILFFLKNFYENALSLTALICVAVVSGMLGIKIYIYLVMILANALANILLYMLFLGGGGRISISNVIERGECFNMHVRNRDCCCF